MKLVDVDELLIAFGFDWSDIMPTHEELVEWIRRQPEVTAKQEHDKNGNVWCGRCGYGFGEEEKWMKYCPSCGARLIKENT